MRCAPLFQRAEFPDRVNRPRADDHVRLAGQNRFDQFLNVRRTILVVRIRVDDDIRATLQARFQAGGERPGLRD